MNIETRLQTYRDRLKDEMSPERIAFYLAEIDDMEAELFLQTNLYELGFTDPIVCETDCLTTLRELMKAETILKVEFFFSWKQFTWLWRIHFYYND